MLSYEFPICLREHNEYENFAGTVYIMHAIACYDARISSLLELPVATLTQALCFDTFGPTSMVCRSLAVRHSGVEILIVRWFDRHRQDLVCPNYALTTIDCSPEPGP